MTFAVLPDKGKSKQPSKSEQEKRDNIDIFSMRMWSYSDENNEIFHLMLTPIARLYKVFPTDYIQFPYFH